MRAEEKNSNLTLENERQRNPNSLGTIFIVLLGRIHREMCRIPFQGAIKCSRTIRVSFSVKLSTQNKHLFSSKPKQKANLNATEIIMIAFQVRHNCVLCAWYTFISTQRTESIFGTNSNGRHVCMVLRYLLCTLLLFARIQFTTSMGKMRWTKNKSE